MRTQKDAGLVNVGNIIIVKRERIGVALLRLQINVCADTVRARMR